MKHILIDGTPMSRQMDGLTQYILNVVLNLDTSLCQYTLLVRPNQCPDSYLDLLRTTGVTVQEVDIAPIGPKRELQFARYLRTNAHFDAAFIPSNQFPVSLRIPSVYVVHDLIYEQFPLQLGRLSVLKRWYLRLLVRIGLVRAKYVVAVSNATKQDILRLHGLVFDEKIRVIYEGWEHMIKANTSQRPLHLPSWKNYLLYVGSSRGHKNLERLLQAIQLASLPNDWGLVLVGDMSHLPMATLQHIQRHTRIYTAGYVTDEEKVWFYEHAAAVILPSLLEGFGIPILEAFYYNKPLLVSSQAAHQEVAGQAAIYFNPYDANDIARTIEHFVAGEGVDETVNQRDRLAQFSWQKCAEQVSYLLKKICNEG